MGTRKLNLKPKPERLKSEITNTWSWLKLVSLNPNNLGAKKKTHSSIQSYPEASTINALPFQEPPLRKLKKHDILTVGVNIATNNGVVMLVMPFWMLNRVRKHHSSLLTIDKGGGWVCFQGCSNAFRTSFVH